MDAAQIRGLKPKLRKYLQQYGECFCRCDTRGHLNTYVTGQLSTLDRKSVEPIALARLQDIVCEAILVHRQAAK